MFKIKKSHIDSSFFDNKIEISYDEELKIAIKNEKNKFKFRISLLTYWGMDSLKLMRRMVNKIYNTFDDWIIDTVEVENEAMNNLITTLRTHIERETNKIKMDNKELDGFDIYKMTDIVDYSDYNPQVPDFSEILHEAKINLEKFKEIYNYIKSFEIQKNFIRTTTFVEAFVIKYLVDTVNEGVYPTIRSLSFHHYNKFVKAFEVIEKNDSNTSSGNNYSALKHSSNMKYIE